MLSFAGGEDYGYFDNPMAAGSIPAMASGRVAQWQSIGIYRRRLIPRREEKQIPRAIKPRFGMTN